MQYDRARVGLPMLLSLLLWAPLVQLSGAATDAAHVTPVQKVIVLLNGMLDKGRQEKHEEQVQFAAYKQFCGDTTAEKQRLITSADEKIDMLKAEIQKSTADSEQLGKEIAGLDTDVAMWSGDEKAASRVRDIEKADYAALHKDYSESVDALQRAIAVLKQQASKQASLAQVSALKGLNLIPQEARKAIDLFLAQQESVEDPDNLAVGAPEAAAYEFQSHGIIEILEKLLDKFVDEKTNAEKAEMNAQHAFQMLMQDLSAQIKQAKEDRSQKASAKAKMLQAKADAQGDLTDTTSTLAADKKYLSDLTASCQTKAADFSDRQKLRAEELKALEQAVAILSDKVAPAADKHLPALLQHKDGSKSAALAQLRDSEHNPAQERVADYLRAQARQLNSRVLSALAVKVAEDPFGKVKKLIKDLIVRLMAEANEEAEHKGWCDVELSTNEQTRQEKTQAVEILHAEIDELQASVAQLSEEIVAGTQAVADLDSAMADSTKIRMQEKADNEAAIADAKDAQAAVAQAVVVLEEFYAKAGDATALVQKKKQEPPAIFDSPYTGMQSEKGGVIGMLEVVQADFARLETDTSAAEASAQKDYDDFMTDSKVDKAQKQKDIEYKSAKKQDQEQSLTTKNSDLQGTQRELDAALSYYDKLRPSCVDAGSSYDDRVARRKEEIESLQEALRILNGEDIA